MRAERRLTVQHNVDESSNGTASRGWLRDGFPKSFHSMFPDVTASAVTCCPSGYAVSLWFSLFVTAVTAVTGKCIHYSRGVDMYLQSRVRVSSYSSYSGYILSSLRCR